MQVERKLIKDKPPAVKLPSVLVSVLGYQSGEQTIAALNSFNRQSYRNYHLQLIENDSADQDIKKIKDVFPDLDVKPLRDNLGYTGGNNLALSQCLTEGYDYVLIANHDIELDEDAIQCLIETAESRKDAGIVGGVEICYFTGETVLVERKRFSLWFMRPKNSATNPVIDENALPVSDVQGALILFTRRVLEAGLFWDDNLFMYYDEIDMGLELKHLGLRPYVDTRVRFRHKNRAKWLNPRSGYFQQRNRLYLAKKRGQWYHKVFYLCYSTLIELPLKVVIRVVQGHWPFAKACIWGQIDALTGKMGKGRADQFKAS